MLSLLKSLPLNVLGYMRRNKKKVIALTLLSWVIYYLSRKSKQLTQFKEQEHQYLSHMRLQNYFESAQRTCDTTIASFFIQLRGRIEEMIEIPSSTQIRSCQSKDEKIALLEKLKPRTFARTFVGIYSVVLLALLLRIQVNLVGRYLHLRTVLAGVVPSSEPAFGTATEKRYLAYAEYLLQNGLQGLVKKVELATEEVLATWPLSRVISYDDTLRIILEIRRKIEYNKTGTFELDELLGNFLPPESEDVNLDDLKLGLLLGETRNILESEEFRKVAKICVDSTFLGLTRNIRSSLTGSTNGSDSIDTNPDLGTVFTLPPAPVKMPLVRFTSSVVNEQFEFVLPNGFNEVLGKLSTLPPVQEFFFSLFKLDVR